VIIVAIFFLTGGPRLFHESRAHLRNAITYGVMSGVLIATYTIWDRYGVAKLGVPPLVYDAGTAFTQLALLTPFAWRRRPEVAAEWRDKKRWAIAVALLSPVAYVLVLTALTLAPVSYVAPAREVSIVIGAFLGAKLLKESDGRRRIWAAAAMAVGVIALALG
jgi:drug/metabolite transporter (DMT)-like permease